MARGHTEPTRVLTAVAASREESTAESPVEQEDATREVQKKPRLNIQRYKGLGEMNPEQLWETTMNPANRMMKRVMIVDAAKADETFDVLMGSDVMPRKRYIQAHAKNVKNLDI